MFTHIRPVSMPRDTRMARLISRVQTAPPRPYSLSLAMAMTSSSVLNLMTTATGPKISSWATRISLVTLVIRVEMCIRDRQGYDRFRFLMN